MPASEEPESASEPTGSAAPANSPAWVSAVRRETEALDYGAIQIVVQNGRVAQIEVTEKIRLQNQAAAGGRAPGRSAPPAGSSGTQPSRPRPTDVPHRREGSAA
ncbi:MAG: YezD family protein [Opitutaceae bacterium]|nr:YezD family protein [Opitutaceae bacterium]